MVTTMWFMHIWSSVWSTMQRISMTCTTWHSMKSFATSINTVTTISGNWNKTCMLYGTCQDTIPAGSFFNYFKENYCKTLQNVIYYKSKPVCWNWQTRRTQNLVRPFTGVFVGPLVLQHIFNWITAFGFNIPPAYPSKIRDMRDTGN